MSTHPSFSNPNIRSTRPAETHHLSVYEEPGAGVARQNQPLIFASTVMSHLVSQAKRLAPYDASILLTGESGTGKEVLSQFIHENSHRAGRRFVAVNCAAIPEQLVESEFFGHERGAFTGAVQQRIGHFERAQGGTILLDEISEIPPAVQAKLLRVLEAREVQRVGGSQSRPIDVRVIATTNRDLVSEISKGKFRLDLYHRLKVLELKIPSLRERPDDIRCLANHFLDVFKRQSKRSILGFTEKAVERLCQMRWLGNVRELKNAIHRACLLCETSRITTDLLPVEQQANNAEGNTLSGLKLVEIERIVILDSLRRWEGDKKEAANELGVTTRTLNNKLKIYREGGLMGEGDQVLSK